MPIDDFIPGQRWISTSELQLGLGTILSVEHRTITILFLSTGETRIYAKASAPLSRVRFAPGDRIRTHAGWTLHVDSVSEHEGLLTYHGHRESDNDDVHAVTEGELDNFIQLNGPADRLFTNQIDPDKWFELRYQTLQHSNRLKHSHLYGLCGCRTSLIAHQLYIAHEVANRYAPRVLLADEVGLGKTIEAGMILHQQLLTERAQRVLIVVPETLVHQWLVEMLRRFNLAFSIFDDERWQSMLDETTDTDSVDEASESNETINPFHSEQLILCSLDFVTQDPQRFEQMLDGDWDLLVVDEAHHLQWSAIQSSIEYDCIAELAANTKGVLLLTATPEQLGKDSHFARLRLLDPDRFPDYQRFIDEESRFAPIAATIEELLGLKPGQRLSQPSLTILEDTFNEGDNQRLLAVLQQDGAEEHLSQARDELVSHLLDRHGTGRVLFRNTRGAIKGFPGRRLHSYPLELPVAYRELVLATDQPLQHYLSPELAYIHHTGNIDWTRIDPRIGWLLELLKRYRNDKILVICAHANTALDITTALRTQAGIHAAVFHEHLTIIERDRAAAFFADSEFGSQVLVCSEIGSEGRNFQFAHHLVLFDLPLNPDLLEQRIGRLDRIGQQQTIQIHVPYLEGTAQATLFNWYHLGLSSFEQTCPAGQNVFNQVEPTLIKTLTNGIADNIALENLIKQTSTLHESANLALQQGRDRLLEYNSCRPKIATKLKQDALQYDVNENDQLSDYLGNLFDSFGIVSEDHSDFCQIIRAGDHMQISSLPGLTADGMVITYDRDTALTKEDIQFISWEHPLTLAAMDNILSNELGNTSMTTCKYNQARPGMLLLECLYVIEPVGQQSDLSNRHLPSTIMRIVIDQDGRDHEKDLAHEAIQAAGQPLNADTRQKVIRARGEILRDMFNRCDQLAATAAVSKLNDIHQQIGGRLLNEVNRLTALQRVNPNIRRDEIEYFNQQLDNLNLSLEHTQPRLDAARVIITV